MYIGYITWREENWSMRSLSVEIYGDDDSRGALKAANASLLDGKHVRKAARVGSRALTAVFQRDRV